MRITETLRSLGATISEASFSVKDDTDGKQYRQKLDVGCWQLFDDPNVLAAAIATASEPAKVSHKETGLSARTESHLLGASVSVALTGSAPRDLITIEGRSKLKQELMVLAARERQEQQSIVAKHSAPQQVESAETVSA